MINWLHDSGISGWWKYSAYLSAFLPGERTPRCALARSNLIYICTSYTCLHTGDSTTPLLSAQRVSPLRFVWKNKHRPLHWGTHNIGFSSSALWLATVVSARFRTSYDVQVFLSEYMWRDIPGVSQVAKVHTRGQR